MPPISLREPSTKCVQFEQDRSQHKCYQKNWHASPDRQRRAVDFFDVHAEDACHEGEGDVDERQLGQRLRAPSLINACLRVEDTDRAHQQDISQRLLQALVGKRKVMMETLNLLDDMIRADLPVAGVPCAPTDLRGP